MSNSIWLSDKTLHTFGDKDNLSDQIATRGKALDFVSYGTVGLPDPDPVLRKRGVDLKVYEELLVDGHLGGIVESRKAGVHSLEWQIVQGEADQRQFDLIDAMFDSFDFEDVTDEILNAPLFGYQPLEVLWEEVAGLALPGCVVGKPPEWFNFSEKNELRFKTQKNPNGEELPPRKFLLARNSPTYKNPYGKRILSRCFWPVTFKRGGIKFWVKFVEKFGMPQYVGKLPRGSQETDQTALLNLLERMVQDAIAVIPDDSSVEILDSPFRASSTGTYDTLVNVMNMEMSKTVLGQTLTTQMQPTGALAASETHMEVRKEVIDKDKKIVSKVWNTLIRWTYEINWPEVPLDKRPKFEFFEEEDVDMDVATRDKTLTDQGVRLSKDYYVKTYGFDEDDIDEVVPVGSPSGSEFQQGRSQSDLPVQNDIDELGDRIADDADELQSQAEAMLDVVFEIASSSSTFEEFNERVAQAYPEMDSGRLQDGVEQSTFISQIWSRLNAEKG